MFIIDPGDDAQEIAEEAEKLKFSEAVILFTHGHFDHIGAAAELVRRLNVRFCYLSNPDHELFYSPDNCFPPYFPPVSELPEVVGRLGLEEPEVIPTPGHTPGGACFYFRSIPALFSGDTLFASGIGRTDFPGGDLNALLKSIRSGLFALPDDTPVYPGHGPATTIGREKRVNSYV